MGRGFMAWEDSYSPFEIVDKVRDLLAGVPVDDVFDDGEREALALRRMALRDLVARAGRSTRTTKTR